MAEKKVSLIISAKNNLMVGLKSAGAALKRFGESARRIGAFFAKAFLRAGAAVAGLATVALRAFSVQEKAEVQAQAAFRAFGEEVDRNTEKVKAFAAAIQDETGIGDENTIARAAKLKLLGVETDSLEAAAKATIALQKAGMGEATALKAVAAATQGDFEALQRYIPALKTANSDAEKAAIVNDFVTKSYAAQKDELNTVSGQWEAFKGRVGDALEALGKAVDNSGAARDAIKRAGEAVKDFGERVQRWIAGGGLVNAIATIKLFGENARNVFTKSAIIAEGFFLGGVLNPAKKAFQFVGSIVGNFFNVFRARMELQRKFTAAVWTHAGEVIKVWANNTKARLQLAADFAIAVAKKIAKPWREFKPPDMAAFRDSLQEVSKFEAPDTTEFKSAFADLGKALKGEFVEKVPNAFEEMFDKLEDEEQRHAGRVQDISKDQLAALKGDVAARVEIEKQGQEEIVVAAQNAAKEKKELEERAEALAKEVARKEQDAKRDAINKEIAALEKAQAKRKDIAAKTVADILAEAQAVKQAEELKDREAKRAERIRAKQRRGIRISKEDAEFLAAFEQIEKARGGMAGGQQMIQGAEKRLQLLDKQGKKLSEIKAELEKTRGQLKELLTRRP